MQRIVAPELLDSMASDDPEAIRSRADLKFINRMMAGETWIIKELKKSTENIYVGASTKLQNNTKHCRASKIGSEGY